MIPQSKIPKDAKIFISGIAGLVGQNLSLRLSEAGFTNICGVDKHANNLKILNEVQPNISTLLADLAVKDHWCHLIETADVVIINQAQIGGLNYNEFHQNNIVATQNILNCLEKNKKAYVVQISSSVVNSEADDLYTQSKTEQEILVKDAGINGVILRPTLMFGWFDRKHLGWLRRFMAKSFIFPIPGNGKYRRQPLYVGDFCKIIISCIENQPIGTIFDISGREFIYYIDLIKMIKAAINENTLIVKIPYFAFFVLIWCAGLLTKNPPFTVHQLRALVIPEMFKIIDWPEVFDVPQTSLADAINETFLDPVYSNISLEF